jgi:hypothetical protein
LVEASPHVALAARRGIVVRCRVPGKGRQFALSLLHPGVTVFRRDSFTRETWCST